MKVGGASRDVGRRHYAYAREASALGLKFPLLPIAAASPLPLQRTFLALNRAIIKMDREAAMRVAIPIITALLGVVVGHLLTERRARLTQLRYWIETSRVADPPPGLSNHPQALEVRYNGRPVKDLHVSKIQLRNSGPADLRELTMTVRAGNGLVIISASGTSEGNPDSLNEQDPPPLKELDGRFSGGEVTRLYRRDFLIPVLNRKAGAELTVVYDRHSSKGALSVTCNHFGVTLVQGHPTEAIELISRDLLIAFIRSRLP